MTVLEQILGWSKDRPAWQRDALRRLVVNGELTEDDIRDLAEICKSAHGLSEQSDIVPLEKKHIPGNGHGSAKITLLSIFHHVGVNALAGDQTLKFGPNLTVVYGDNAAGKTGYIRILRSACRARGPEAILGNVVSGAAPHKPVVAIKYKVGNEEGVREWSGEGEDEFISQVSVFDTQCAAVYVTEKTDVAFRPFGLDLFDKLVKACKAVRSRLEGEQRALAPSALGTLQTQVPESTAVGKLLTSLSSLTKPTTVEALAHVSPDEDSRLELLERSLLDLQTSDSEKLARQLDSQSGRIRALAQHFKNVEAALSADAVASIFQVRDKIQKITDEAEKLRAGTFPTGVLKGTGSDLWLALWEAARRFSQQLAYPAQPFPFVDDGAHCVLCQQQIGDAAGLRLKKFEAFVVSTIERELRDARERFTHLRRALTDLTVATDTAEETTEEIRIENEDLAHAIAGAVATNEKRKNTIALALTSGEPTPECPAVLCVSDQVDALVEQLEKRIRTLRTTAKDENKKRMGTEVLELRARKVLARHQQRVLDEVERKKKIAAYELCFNDTKTHAITQKSTAVTRTAVTHKLKRSFQDELSKLTSWHIEVELKEIGGEEGILYHKLALTRAPGVDLPRVVSEGEQRCLSIAAFFAELSTADDPSGIVFDDPVSSLDYKWREDFARRLVTEAKVRQVIVFTHDIVFLLLLKQFAEEHGVEQLDQHVRQLSVGAGVCTDEMPWVALAVKKKIGYLKKEFQAAEKLFRDGHQAAYEKEAKYLYGLLRETWERALEEVLLGGVVERYRPGVQTQQVSTIADITQEDCKALDAAMTKCSKWLPGHDQAAAARAEIPQPSALKSDIETLENWVATIRKRRGK